MARIDARTVPLDSTSQHALAASGFRYAVVDPEDDDAARSYIEAESRGFLGGEQSDDEAAEFREQLAYRRWVGVYDAAADAGSAPVATVNSWTGELSVPGARAVPFWAISGVTVSPTRRRRGIARAMLEGELRAARDAGLAIAGLTVSEATIYGRFGFAPAVRTADWMIDTRRAGWAGPDAPGTLDHVDRSDAVALLGALHDRVRVDRPGEVDGWLGRWRQFASVARGSEHPGRTRAVAYTSPQGERTGLLVYRITEDETDFARHTLDVRALFADGPDAYAALWRFAIEHDLVHRVHARLRSVEEPLPWMLRDERGLVSTARDHGWLRILDVPAALRMREYSAAADVTIEVADPQGFATGCWSLRIGDDRRALIDRTDVPAQVELSAAALAAGYLGGVRFSTLRGAGLVRGDSDAIAALDRAFTAPTAPGLGIWY
jgi:predicted acetyltransferase